MLGASSISKTLRELQSLAEAEDLLMQGRVASAGCVLIQRFCAVETASLEEGRWSVARHLEVLPEVGVSTVPSGLRGVMIRAEWARRRLRQGQWKQSPRQDPEEKERPFARDQRWKSVVEEEEPRAHRQRGQQNANWGRSDHLTDQQRNNQARGGQKGQSKGKRNK